VKQEFAPIVISTHGPGLYSFGIEAGEFVQNTGIVDGLLTCFIRHTSASLERDALILKHIRHL